MRTVLGSWRSPWRRVGKVGKAEVEVEEAEARRRARRTASRGGGGGRGGGRACALIKFNHPHLAGGEILGVKTSVCVCVKTGLRKSKPLQEQGSAKGGGRNTLIGRKAHVQKLCAVVQFCLEHIV